VRFLSVRILSYRIIAGHDKCAAAVGDVTRTQIYRQARMPPARPGAADTVSHLYSCGCRGRGASMTSVLLPQPSERRSMSLLTRWAIHAVASRCLCARDDQSTPHWHPRFAVFH